MEDEEHEIVQHVDTDESNDDSSSDSDNEDLKETYLTAVRYHSKCSKKELKRLLKSTEPSDKEKFIKIVMGILSFDNNEAFYYLLRKGFKPDVHENEQTIYHWAYYQNSLSILSLLFNWLFEKSNNVDYVDNNNLSCLHIVSFAGNEKAVSDYLKFSKNINAHYQCKNQDWILCTMESCRDGFTPLHFAVINYKAEKVVELLVDNGADVNAVDVLNRTPMHIVCLSYESPGYMDAESDSYNSISVMKVLLKYKSDINAKDLNGNTPLLSIFPDDFGDFETMRGLGFIEDIPVLEIKAKLKILLEHKVDVAASNENADNILHLIVKNLEHWRCSTTYSELSFDVDVHHRDMIEQIFNASSKIDVNAKNKKGETPLQLAVLFISSKVVKVLLEHGADLSNIAFDYRDHEIFAYPKILPDLDAVLNLLEMVELLVMHDWDLTLETNLAILKFLVHDSVQCQCHNLSQVFHLGSAKHINHIVNEQIEWLSDNSIDTKNEIAMRIQEFLISKLIVGISKDIEVLRSLLTAFDKLSPVIMTINGDQYLLDLLMEKIIMSSTKLTSNFTLDDVMTKHPNDIYHQVKNDDFQSIAKKFPIYQDLIKGHVAKAFVRHYLENSAYAYLKQLSLAYLPYTCCKRILHYSSNEDILNVCLAAVLE